MSTPNMTPHKLAVLAQAVHRIREDGEEGVAAWSEKDLKDGRLAADAVSDLLASTLAGRKESKKAERAAEADAAADGQGDEG